MTPPHAQTAEAVVAGLGTDPVRGLAADQIHERRTRHGFNQLAETPPVPRWRRFLAQFQELMIAILIGAAAIAGLVGEHIDAVAILAIVVLNATASFLQEERAERALAALQQLAAPMARVRRQGVLQQLPARELVPGDVLALEAGDHVPDDARLIEAFNLRMQEAALTGESTAVEKDAHAAVPAAAALGDRCTMAYMSTVVAAGKAAAVVVATGMHTEVGRIAGLLQSAEREPTPLQRRLAELGKILAVVCLGLVVIVGGMQILQGAPLLETLLLAVSLAVAAVPEGLPAVVTITLAVGLHRMARRHALVRKLASVETLGSVTVICTDKTGTLTRNEMTVREVVVDDRGYRVAGVGYAPEGAFSAADGRPNDEAALRRALLIGARCNNAQVRPRAAGGWEVVGDPTEGALLTAARKAGVAAADRGRLLYEIPFDSERKTMSVVVREAAGAVMYSKGAPEALLAKCSAERRAGQVQPLTAERRQAILQQSGELAGRALRVLALAEREHPGDGSRLPDEADLVFTGLVGMIDPPREEVKDAVARCRASGIKPVMITGDHPATALAIARELGIAADGDRALTGRDLDALDDAALAAQVAGVSVYARVSAEHKLRVVNAWKARGATAAMTGDGVNDAPAVQAASIGIAMGLTGADVTKEASAMVLTDDNFVSIVAAVEEGRVIYDNIQKFLRFLLASNASEVLFMFFAALVGWPAPLLAIQILWINLVTDSLPALALALEPPERDVMRRRPRPPHESVITWRHGLLMLVHGSLIAAVTAAAFALVHRAGAGDVARARTTAFCVIAFAQLFYAFSCRGWQRTLPELGLFTNPYLFAAVAVSALLQVGTVTLPFAQPIFKSAALSAADWALIAGLALLPVTVVEIAKFPLRWAKAGRP